MKTGDKPTTQFI